MPKTQKRALISLNLSVNVVKISGYSTSIWKVYLLGLKDVVLILLSLNMEIEGVRFMGIKYGLVFLLNQTGKSSIGFSKAT